MDKVIDNLVESSALPISVIIIGLGNANFEKMMILDGEKGLSNKKGVRAERDIV